MPDAFYKAESRKDWYVALNTGDKVGDSRLMLGCAMRTADALESIAKSKVDLERERDEAKRDAANLEADLDYLYRSRSAYKGVITKLKRKLGFERIDALD